MRIPSVSRRKLFKLSGGGLLAGIVGGSPVKVPPTLSPLAGMGMESDAPQAISSATREGWLLMDTWRSMRAPNAHSYKIRDGAGQNLDPDIACLQSVSPCMKMWMQRERDLAVDGQMETIAKFFGVDSY